jgi:hypothetical protein
VHFGDKGSSKIEAGLAWVFVWAVDGAADDLAELGNEHLLCFIDDVNGREKHGGCDEKENPDEN